jgi:hypothetical protein
MLINRRPFRSFATVKNVLIGTILICYQWYSFQLSLRRIATTMATASFTAITPTFASDFTSPTGAISTASRNATAVQPSSHTTVFLYSTMRTDRSGAVIADMLKAHAYVFALNHHDEHGKKHKYHGRQHIHNETAQVRYIYGGACPTRKMFAAQRRLLAAHRKLLKVCGLEELLPFACPFEASSATPSFGGGVSPGASDTSTFLKQWNTTSSHWRHLFITRKDYWTRRVDAMFQNQLYQKALQRKTVEELRRESSSVSIASPFGTNDTAAAKKVTIHVRRGDVGFCGSFSKRYLPNQHYLDLIDRLTATDMLISDGTSMSNSSTNIVIHSEEPYGKVTASTTESFEDFTVRGLSVRLGAPVTQVWQDVLESDVIVLSRSSFSWVPAFLAGTVHRTATVVYTPYIYHTPLPGWMIVDDIQMNRTNKVLKMLRNRTCPKKKLK